MASGPSAGKTGGKIFTAGNRWIPRLAFAWLWLVVAGLSVLAIRRGTDAVIVVAGLILTIALLLQIHRQHARLSGLAWTDAVTGLANHRGFHERLELELARARRDGTSLSLVTLDLDNFKGINDRHGHPYGDEILKLAAAKLAGAVRDSDTAARTGGEEFGLILPRTGPEAALEIAERARAAVGEVPVRAMRLSCSAGVAAYPADAADAATLCRLSDGALYWAKRTGKHRARRFDPQHVAAGDDRRRRTDLTAVIEDGGGIVPVYQPVVALATGRLIGYEALARFPGSKRSAEAWFAEAHALGLGPKLEAAAIRAALLPLGRPPGTHLALNLSPSGLMSEEVREALPRDLTDLVIEVTEHEDIADRPELIGELESLRERGALIAIDDAGAGYSGLKALMQARPDVVKLDREVIRGISGNPARNALVESFVRFAARIDATVCAEGIEHLDDLAAAADMDVAWGQGHALARPQAPWAKVDPLARELCRTALSEALRTTPHGKWTRNSAGDRLLEDISSRLAGARSRADLEDALALIAAVLDAEKICLSRWYPENDTVEMLVENGEASPEIRFSLAEYPLTAKVLREREAVQVMVGDPRADAEEIELLLSLGYRSLLMVPVIHQGDSIGILEAYSHVERPWTRTAINRARIISNQFASTIGAFFLDDPGSRREPGGSSL